MEWSRDPVLIFGPANAMALTEQVHHVNVEAASDVTVAQCLHLGPRFAEQVAE